MAGPTRDDGDRGEPLDDDTVAARWAELTASLGDLGTTGPAADGARGTSSDTASPDRPSADGPAGRVPAAGPPTGTPAGPPPGTPAGPPPGPRDYAVDDDDEGAGVDAFVPPEPAPLTHADPALTLGWVATVGSMLVGIVLALVWRPVPGGVLAVLGLVLLAGVALLLWRMPAHDDDRSDGAVV